MDDHGTNKASSAGGGLGIAVVVLLAALVLYVVNRHKSSNSFKHPLPELNEQGTKQWSDADKYLPSQTFTLQTNQDTVIQTRGGLIVAVPANCFLGDDGKPVSGAVQLEIKEALDAASMMKAGLSTKSGNRLLESAGMFYLNGRKDGKSLKINPNNGIYVHVPADSIKSGMQAFEGKRMPDGTIDWVNPKPLMHDLVPVNIHTLNFYPPLYLDSLAAWGKDIKNKKYTDSLYYSFASLFGDQNAQDSIIREGAKLFRANCTDCHAKTGLSSLSGIINKVPQPYQDWLLKYIKNNSKFRKSGDAYANKVYTDNNASAMTSFEGILTDKQIKSIIAFLVPYRSYYPKDTTNYFQTQSDSSVCGINPAKIKAIWNDEFQNTLISTREFEERMPYIHKTENSAILDLYVNNLDKNLSGIDSLAAEELGGDLKTVFLSFAARGDDRVAVKSSLFKKLMAFFEKKSKLFTEAAVRAQNKLLEKENKLTADIANKENAEANRDDKREAIMRGDEYKQNMKEACRQVGDPDSVGITDKNGYAVLCTGTGWTNIDFYAEQSTLNRTTLNYTSPVNGKTAIIKYVPFSVTVSDYEKYDNVFVYLLPDKLNSFMRLSDTNGRFKENLDELFSYKMECIAYKGSQAFYYSMNSVSPKDYDRVNLAPVSIDELNEKLGELGNKNQKNDMAKELEYMQFENKAKEQLKKNEDTANFRNKVQNVIFPCWPPQQEGGAQHGQKYQ